MAVKNVIIYNRVDDAETRLFSAKVSLIDSASKTLESIQLHDNAKQAPYSGGKYDVECCFDCKSPNVIAWKSPSPTGQPLLSDAGRNQLGTHFKKSLDSLDISIALVFGDKTTIGQVCSFAKGLTSNIVSSIPGFCCLDAPYESKVEEWGQQVSSW